MDEQKPKDPLLTISGLVALVLALGAVMYSMTPLKGTRPSIPDVREAPSMKIRARLWQDPFRAVLDDVKARGKVDGSFPAGQCLANLRKQQSDDMDQKKRLSTKKY